MYNVERYVGECLDSLLAQTFQDFEIIVVDDCSTDNSAEIVESYAQKFGGRLKLANTKKNTGSAGLPRNKGIELSRGEYLSFIDPDDTITPTALETFYTCAKNFDADVVHCEKYYKLPAEYWDDAEFRRNLKPYSYQTGEFVTEPTLLTGDISERVKMFCQKRFVFSVCMKLFRRDFIIDNEIKLGDIFAEDTLFTICALCTAKRFVIIPNVMYYYRANRANSQMNSQSDISKLFHRQIKALTNGIRYLDEFLNRRDLFSQRPNLKYDLFNAFTWELLNYLTKIYIQIPAPALDELLRKEFAGSDNPALMSFLFSTVNVQRLQLMQAQQQFNRFAAQAQARIAELEAEVKRLRS